MQFERALAKVPGATFGDDIAPLVHTFVDGAYVREIQMPKGMLLTSKIHKVKHPYFVLKGDVSVLTEKGTVRIKAPYYGVTEPGTKRILYIHEDTVWVTVHVTKEKDLKAIEHEVIASDYKELGLPVDVDDEQRIIDFIEKIKLEHKEDICLGEQ